VSQPAAGPSTWQFSQALRLLVAIALPVMAAAALSLGGCGGVGSGGTGLGSYVQGSITGFGSVIVNDVRFDDSQATVEDVSGAVRGRDALKLGMTVEVEGGAISSDATGRSAQATRFRYGSQLMGPVTAVDAAAGQFTLLGQTVATDPVTVFDSGLASGLASLSPGQLVEVYAPYDAASGVYRATRIEPVEVAIGWSLSGPVQALDNTARSLRIGAATAVWGQAVNIPATLAVGQNVRLQLADVTDEQGRYTVMSFGSNSALPDRDEAEFKGLITAFTSAAAFSVNGVAVDASRASFPDGTAGLGLGARVEVRGSSQDGRLVADRVSIESQQGHESKEFEFKGLLEAVDPAQRTITVRGQLISTANPSLRYKDGTAADLVVGRRVEVKTRLDSATRTRLEATEIEFD
jgi:hypothetical protein